MVVNQLDFATKHMSNNKSTTLDVKVDRRSSYSERPTTSFDQKVDEAIKAAHREKVGDRKPLNTSNQDNRTTDDRDDLGHSDANGDTKEGKSTKGAMLRTNMAIILEGYNSSDAIVDGTQSDEGKVELALNDTDSSSHKASEASAKGHGKKAIFRTVNKGLKSLNLDKGQDKDTIAKDGLSKSHIDDVDLASMSDIEDMDPRFKIAAQGDTSATLGDASLDLQSANIIAAAPELGRITVVDNRSDKTRLENALKSSPVEDKGVVEETSNIVMAHADSVLSSNTLVTDTATGGIKELGEKASVKDGGKSSVKHSTTQLELSLMDKAISGNAVSHNGDATPVIDKGEGGFQSLLNAKVRDMAGDIVRSGQLVLNDNNTGTINLVMHPESLGNVKLRLTLTDKVITGSITVASKEAWEAFREGIPSLQEAFEQNGFESAGFNLNFQGGNGQGYNGQGEQVAIHAKGRKVYSDEGIADVKDTSLIDEMGDRILDVVA